MPTDVYDGDAEFDSDATYTDDVSGPESKTMAKTRPGKMKKQTAAQKGVAGDLIITKVTGNTHYPDADAVLGAFSTANTKVKADNAALEIALQVVEEKRASLEASEAEWDVTLTALSDHVQSVSKGDLMMLQSTGFELQGVPAPIGELLAPTKVSARTNGVAGVIKLRFNRSRGATHYVVQRASANPNDEASWETLDTVSAASFEDTGLTSGTKYWYRIAAKGFTTTSGWSNPVCKMAA